MTQFQRGKEVSETQMNSLGYKAWDNTICCHKMCYETSKKELRFAKRLASFILFVNNDAFRWAKTFSQHLALFHHHLLQLFLIPLT